LNFLSRRLTTSREMLSIVTTVFSFFQICGSLGWFWGKIYFDFNFADGAVFDPERKPIFDEKVGPEGEVQQHYCIFGESKVDLQFFYLAKL
jgi:hypothetical protein